MRYWLRRFVCFALGHMYGYTPTTKDTTGEGYACLRCERMGRIHVNGSGKVAFVPLKQASHRAAVDR